LLSWPETSIDIKTPGFKDGHWVKPFVTYLRVYDIILDEADELIKAVLFGGLDLLIQSFQETGLEASLEL
jgi:hypothetical protein